MSVLDQNGRIQALGFLSWLCPLQVTHPITTFLTLGHFYMNFFETIPFPQNPVEPDPSAAQLVHPLTQALYQRAH